MNKAVVFKVRLSRGIIIKGGGGARLFYTFLMSLLDVPVEGDGGEDSSHSPRCSPRSWVTQGPNCPWGSRAAPSASSEVQGKRNPICRLQHITNN